MIAAFIFSFLLIAMFVALGIAFADYLESLDRDLW